MDIACTINNGKGETIMNEFFKVIELLKRKNPTVGVCLDQEPDKMHWTLKVVSSGKEIFQVIGSDIDLLFQTAYGKLQTHRKELV